MVNLDKKTKKKIKEFIPDYLKFMKIKSLPDFDIKTLSGNAGTLRVDFETDKPVLYIQDTYTSILKSNSKAGIFHEFTHILDHFLLLPELTKEEREPLIKMYCEYHAMEVQMKQSLHFNTYYDTYNFQFSTRVHDWFDNKTVKEDIVYKTKDYLATLKSLAKEQKDGYLYDLLLHSIYYIGQSDFWIKYCKDNVESYIINSIFPQMFGEYYNLYHSYLKSPQNTEAYFKILHLYQSNMIKYYLLNNGNNFVQSIKYNQ